MKPFGRGFNSPRLHQFNIQGNPIGAITQRKRWVFWFFMSGVAQWIARTLELKGKPKKDKKSGTIHIGNFQGRKKIALLE